MPRPFLILDGYNVLHAAGFARFSGEAGELQAAREGLLDYLADCLTPVECARTHVVFDAMNAPTGLPRTYKRRGISIQFAEPGGDADTVIEDLIKDHDSPRQARVVSSDHRIQRAAKRRKCQFTDSEDWLARLEKRMRRQSNSPTQPLSVEEAVKRGGKMAPEEVTRWLNEFNGVDVKDTDDATKPKKDGGWADGIERLK